MSQENVEAHKRAIEALNRRDFETFRTLGHDEDIEVSTVLTVEGTYRGYAGVRRWWDDLLGTFPDWKVEVVELRDYGDKTLGVLQAAGRGASGHTPVGTSFWQVVHWRDGRATRWASFGTEREALKAVGLSE